MNMVFGSGFATMIGPGAKRIERGRGLRDTAAGGLPTHRDICLTGDQLWSHSCRTSLAGLPEKPGP